MSVVGAQVPEMLQAQGIWAIYQLCLLYQVNEDWGLHGVTEQREGRRRLWKMYIHSSEEHGKPQLRLKLLYTDMSIGMEELGGWKSSGVC